MKKFLFYISAIFITLLSVAQNAFASCDVGPVLFRDTLYGTGVGAGVGALVLLSNSNSNNIAPTLATSALVGAGVGMVIGVVEISLSDCTIGKKNKEDSYNYGFNLRPIITVVDTKLIEPSIQQEKHVDLSFNQLGGGVTMEYKLN